MISDYLKLYSNEVITLDENGYQTKTTSYNPNTPVEESKKQMDKILSDYEQISISISALTKAEFSREKENICRHFFNLFQAFKESTKIHYELVEMIYKMQRENKCIEESLINDVFDLLKQLEPKD